MERPDLPVDQLSKMLDLQERIMNKNAESAFNRALAEFQKECPLIERKKNVSFKSTNYSYATLDEMIYTIKPLLSKHGLSYSFDTKYGENEFELMTIISHVDGHSKTYSLTFPKVHDDERMNKTQRMKSSLTYGKRAGLENALGIVTTGEDDDARRLNEAQINADQMQFITALIKKTNSDMSAFLSAFEVDSVDQLNNEQFKKAKSMLSAKLNSKNSKAKA